MNEENKDVLSPEIKFQLVRKLERHKVVGLMGTELLPHEAKYLEFHRLAGVVLFERNLENLPQLSDLIAGVEEKLADDGRPPLVMADHEGDFVSELRKLIGVPPSAMAIAATGDPRLARDVAYETGCAMAKLGVNVVLAPVADCFVDPLSPITGLRSFGRDPDKVAAFVGETIGGFQDAGIITCVKHFPGHGATPGDSHESLPEIKKGIGALRSGELVPFAEAIRRGVDMVMTAHVVYTLGASTDEGVPASFDPRLIRGVLRDELGFDGVVITDALEMEGARQHARTRYGGLTGGFERSVLAGSDLMLYSSAVPEKMTTHGDSEPMIAVEVMQTIIETLSRVVDRSRIEAKLEDAAQHHEGVRNLLTILDQSETRVTKLRERAGELRSPPEPKLEDNVINLQDYASTPAIYKTVAEKSLVLVRDPDKFIPVDAKQEWYLLPVEYHEGESLKRQDMVTFVDGLRRIFPVWKAAAIVVGFEADSMGRMQPRFAPEDGWRARLTGKTDPAPLPEDAAVIPVLSARGAPPDDFLVGLTQFVEERQAPLVIVTGWPLIDWVPETTGCVLTFGASAPVAAAVAGLLRGEVAPTGALQGLM